MIACYLGGCAFFGVGIGLLIVIMLHSRAARAALSLARNDAAGSEGGGE